MEVIKKRFIFLFILMTTTQALALPSSFVYLKEIAPSIEEDLRYYTAYNFIGRPIQGYEKPRCILTKVAAEALLKIQNKLSQQGLGLKVFDCYRPQMAVNDFIQWSKDVSDQKMKADYYPRVNKADFFKLGYVAARSGHSRGSTVDLTIIDKHTQKALDMGTSFDFMDERSHPFSSEILPLQARNRRLLRKLMIENGFVPFSTEWWHFTFKNEPYLQTFFNFPVN
jgi:D-alanyl-D-alanine dipeptidase